MNSIRSPFVVLFLLMSVLSSCEKETPPAPLRAVVPNACDSSRGGSASACAELDRETLWLAATTGGLEECGIRSCSYEEVALGICDYQLLVAGGRGYPSSINGEFKVAFYPEISPVKIDSETAVMFYLRKAIRLGLCGI